MPPDPYPHLPCVRPLSRRAFLEHAGLTGAVAVLAQLPVLAGARGLLAEVHAAEPDFVRDTFQGLFAFMLPGDDDYSTAQGQTWPGPGGVASGGVGPMIATLDTLVSGAVAGQPSTRVPVSGALAALINHFAVQVNPAAAGGAFLSPFARLSFEEKAECFHRLEAEAMLSEAVEPIRYIAGLIPTIAAFMAFSEAPVYDSATRRITERPLGWTISAYGGPAEGHAGLKGYYRGRRHARRRRR